MEMGKVCRVETAQVAGRDPARVREPWKAFKTWVNYCGLVFLGWRLDC
jgi:hypothetical protein